MKRSEGSHFSWKIGVIIGVAILVIAGVTLGLVFGLSGGKNVEGVYVWKSNMPESITTNSSKTISFTLILKPNKNVATTASNGGEPDYGTYTMENTGVRVAWDDGKSVSHYTIVDGNLVDEQSNVWIKQ